MCPSGHQTAGSKCKPSSTARSIINLNLVPPSQGKPLSFITFSTFRTLGTFGRNLDAPKKKPNKTLVEQGWVSPRSRKQEKAGLHNNISRKNSAPLSWFLHCQQTLQGRGHPSYSPFLFDLSELEKENNPLLPTYL